MGKPLSLDLRSRLVAAVSEEGMSRRGAAERFGVSAASAVRWVDAIDFAASGESHIDPAREKPVLAVCFPEHLY